MVDVSIIIVTYNTCLMTRECIESVFEKTSGISFEVILVDNNSQDESKEYFSQDSRIKYIFNSRNIGFGPANNLGIQCSRGRNIFFLNSDTLLVNNAIKVLSDYLDNHEIVGACGGNLYSKDMCPLHSFRRLSPLLFELNILLGGILAKCFYGRSGEHNFTKDVLCVNCIIGADLMVKSTVLKEVGLFDSRFFMYCEETELCHRIRNANYNIVSVPNARIIHLEGGSFSADNKRITRIKMNRNSLQLYCSIHYNKLYYFMLDCVWHAIIYSRILYYSLIGSDKRLFWRKIAHEF